MKRSRIVACALVLLVAVTAGCKKDDKVDNTPDIINTTVTPKNTLIAMYSMTSSVTPSKIQVLDSLYNIQTSITAPGATMNFQKWDINGNVRYSYNLFDPSVTPITGVGYVPGWSVILDQNFNELKRVRLMPDNGRGTDVTSTSLDGHEFILLDDDHYIAMAYYQKAVTNIDASLNPAAGGTVVAPIIQEVQNGAVVWEWDGTDHPEFYANSVEGNDFTNATTPQDYMHLNSMCIDPKDNNLICSFRNQNQVVKIDRKTGAIIWRLGGKNSDFPISASQKFLRQHYTKLTSDGTLLMVDNGDATERPYTRIAEFTLDENSKTITAYKSMDMPYSLFCQYMGSVQKIGGSYFVGCGSVPRIIQLDYTTGKVLFDQTYENPSYRALKY